MRKAITFASLILAITILTPASALGKTKGTERPLKFSISATDVVNLETFTNHYAGTEIASHAGKGTLEGNGVLEFSPEVFNTLIYSDRWVFTAANGDKVFGASNGTITGGPEGLVSSHESVLVQTITGGTGRFTNASGTMNATYHEVLTSSAGPMLTYSLQGGGKGSASY
jgi:hypothetical protein